MISKQERIERLVETILAKNKSGTQIANELGWSIQDVYRTAQYAKDAGFGVRATGGPYSEYVFEVTDEGLLLGFHGILQRFLTSGQRGCTAYIANLSPTENAVAQLCTVLVDRSITQTLSDVVVRLQALGCPIPQPQQKAHHAPKAGWRKTAGITYWYDPSGVAGR